MTLKNISKAYLRKMLWSFPSLYYLRYSLTHNSDKLVANKAKDIVIEGPPRVANTFMVESFKHAQSKEYAIAHHMHVPCQLLRAIKHGIPAILLIRNPLDTALSHSISNPNKTLNFTNECLHYYIDFYQPLLSRKDYFVIADFEEIIVSPIEIIDRLNNKFNKQFDNYSKDIPFNPVVVKSSIDNMYRNWGKEGLAWFGEGKIDELKVSRPSELKKEIKSKLKLEVLASEKSIKLLNKANDIYKILKE